MATELIVGEPTHVELGALARAPVEWGQTEYVKVIPGDAPRYEGAYTVTPSAEAQTLDTRGMVMVDSVTISPIPSNYGLIEWNGAVLRVS